MNTKRIFLLSCAVLSWLILLSGTASAASVDSWVNKGNALYRRKQYDEASKVYQKALTEHPNETIIQYNKGVAEYRKNDFENAAGSFLKALSTKDKALEAKAQFGLGNTKYKIAESKKETDLAQAVGSLEGALQSYKRAIELSPQDNDAKVNYELSDRLLRELKKKLDTQEKQQCERQGKKQEDKQQDKSGKKDQEDKESQQQRQEQEKNDQQSSSQRQDKKESAQPEDSQQKDSQAKGAEEKNAKEMTPQEAMMLLEGARQEENIFGRLRDTEQSREQEVEKDW